MMKWRAIVSNKVNSGSSR